MTRIPIERHSWALLLQIALPLETGELWDMFPKPLQNEFEICQGISRTRISRAIPNPGMSC